MDVELSCLLRSWAAAEIDELFERRVPAWRWSTATAEVEDEMRTVVATEKARIDNEG